MSLNQPRPHNSAFMLKGFTFTFFMTNAILLSFFPTYLVSLDFSKTQIGLIYSISPMISIVANLVWGLVSDKYHTIKKTIIALLIGQLCLVLILFQVNAYIVLYVLMTFFYFFQTPMTSLNDSQLLLHTGATGHSYASYRVWGSIGFAFSALAFGIILHSSSNVHHMMWYLMMGTILTSLILSLFLKDSRGIHKKIAFAGLYKIIVSQKLLIFLLLVLVISIAHRTNDAFLSLYLHDLGADESLIGYSWMISALSEIPIFFLLSRYGHRYKELPLLAIASFAFALRFYLVSQASDPVTIVGIQTLHSITFGIFFFTALRYMTQIVPDQFRATGQAIFSITWNGMAGLISSLAGGIIFDHWGGHMLYLVASLVAIIAGLGFLLAHFKSSE